MALKVELKPNERILIGESVITNCDQRSWLVIEGSSPILREKDILTAPRADTPAKRTRGVVVATGCVNINSRAETCSNGVDGFASVLELLRLERGPG